MGALGPRPRSLAALMEAVPFYGRVKLVDLTDQAKTVAKSVVESSLECTEVRTDSGRLRSTRLDSIFTSLCLCFFSFPSSSVVEHRAAVIIPGLLA